MDLVVPEVCSQCTQTCPWNGRRCWCDTGFAWLPDGCSHRLHHNEEKRNSSQNSFTTGITGVGDINNRISGDLETSIMQDELYGAISWVLGPKNWTRLHVPTKHCRSSQWCRWINTSLQGILAWQTACLSDVVTSNTGTPKRTVLSPFLSTLYTFGSALTREHSSSRSSKMTWITTETLSRTL